MVEKKTVVVICDLCTRTERPATHRITIDVCNKHTLRDATEEGNVGYQLDRELNAQDEEDLLRLVSTHPGQRRSMYAGALEWDTKRTANAYGRLRKKGLMQSKGKAQNATWSLTTRGTREMANAV